MQMSMFSSEEHLASRSVSRGCERGWLTLGETSRSPILPSLTAIAPGGSFGRMCLAFCPATEGGTLEPSSGGWGNSGTTGNYLWQPSLQSGEPSQLLSYPLTEMAAMPQIATGALSVAFGNFKKAYLIVDRMGVRVLRDAYTNKPFVHFYTTKRVGGAVVDPTALRILKQA